MPFPTTPNIGDQYTLNSIVYEYNGIGWDKVASPLSPFSTDDLNDTPATKVANQFLKVNGTADGFIYTAISGSDTSYSNATSGLTATEVQSAIDEVEGRVDTVEGNYVTTNSEQTITSDKTFTQVTETVTTKSASFTPNLTTEGTVFKVTATATLTMPTAEAGKSFVVIVTAGDLTFAASPAIYWANNGIIPTYSGISRFVFSCDDGVNWYGELIGTGYAVSA